MLRQTFAASLLIAFTAGPAAADVDRCAGADTELAWRGTDLAEIAGDTGWFPGGSVAQLRLTGRVVGHTAVDAGMRTTSCWDETMQAKVTGRPGTGYLDVAYGAEIKLRARIHTSVLGKSIDWEGNIPIPYIPNDLLLAGETAFNPAIDPTKIARVTDSASAITLLSTDVISSFISISGISGGLRVSVTPVMATSYRTRTATIGTTVVDSSTDLVSITPGEGGFGATLDLPVTAQGLIRYEPTLKFNASLDVKIFGIRVVDWQLFSIPMTLPALERPIKLTGEITRIGLPVLEGPGDGAQLDFASGTTQQLALRNAGEAPLAAQVKSAPAGVVVTGLEISAGGEGHLRVVAADDSIFANGPVSITLSTNDPDQPTLTVLLGKEIGGSDAGGDDVEEPGQAGGCSSTAPSGLGMCFGLALLLVRRRRR
ncbi:MAG: hypothetical protein H0T89_09200 [Deltaproteobacteria bacterium]|nr:hypothetical protein [Deltaproteobacteria bacterium]MDQ3299761.1 hypothetical protein [Myxococcota bacterium]